MPRYYDDDDDEFDDLDIGRYPKRGYRAPDAPRPQSGLGIASLLLSIFCGVSLFGLIAMAGIISINQNGQVNDNDPAMVALGLGILASCGFTLIGLVLGAVGCFQPDRNPICAILGSIFNLLILLGVGSLMCLGIVLGG
jgi:hypothetical protein